MKAMVQNRGINISGATQEGELQGSICFTMSPANGAELLRILGEIGKNEKMIEFNITKKL